MNAKLMRLRDVLEKNKNSLKLRFIGTSSAEVKELITALDDTEAELRAKDERIKALEREAGREAGA